jgi:hypothetical protein
LAKSLPLAEITTVYGDALTFDPGKIAIVNIGVPAPAIPASPSHPIPPTATEIRGVTPGSLYVTETPSAFLAKLNISDDFLKFTFTSGNPVWIKGGAIAWISPNARSDDPKAKSTIAVGSHVWPLLEDFQSVRTQWELARKKSDATS